MAPRVKRQPDAAVGPAVAQAIKQQKSKRMMMFGLRTLAELCSKGHLKYQENSVAAMTEGIIPVLKYSADSYGDDEDVAAACSKILLGTTDYLLEDPNPELIKKFKDEGGAEAVGAILSKVHNYSDEETLFIALSCFDALQKLQIAQ